MNIDPLAVALKEISAARSLLERLVTSSESFDYPQAKIALNKLNGKVRDLTKLEARYLRLQKTQPNVYVLDFKTGSPVEARTS
jgi:hypothetical protein